MPGSPKRTRRKSPCQGKSVEKPNRCKKIRGCKVAKGKKRTFCRKAKNDTRARRAEQAKRSTRRRAQLVKRRSGPWAGFNERQIRELKRLS